MENHGWLRLCCFWLSLFSVSAACANPYCKDILKQGIHDEYSVIDKSMQYRLAHRVHCSSSVTNEERNGSASGFIGIDSFELGGALSRDKAITNSNEFCSSDYQESLSSGKFSAEVRTINSAIVGAWSDCISGVGQAGLVHYITPTSNPEKFIYRIRWKSIPGMGKHSTKLKRWEIVGSSNCEGALKKGTRIDENGEELICQREKGVDVTVSAMGRHGSVNTAAVELPPFNDVVEGVDCYKFISGKEDIGACNEETAPGYYWRLGRKLAHYSVAGVKAVGEQPACGPESVGMVGRTARFPHAHRTFLTVHEHYQNLANAMTAPKCDYYGNANRWTMKDYGNICGVFEAVCSKQ